MEKMEGLRGAKKKVYMVKKSPERGAFLWQAM